MVLGDSNEISGRSSRRLSRLESVVISSRESEKLALSGGVWMVGKWLIGVVSCLESTLSEVIVEFVLVVVVSISELEEVEELKRVSRFKGVRRVFAEVLEG